MRLILAALLLMLAGCAEAGDNAVRLDLTRGVCSGTVVGKNIILTASHCFAEGNRLEKIDGADAYALKIIHDGKDHAIVRVSATFTRWAVIGPELQTGDEVEWIGNPGGQERVFRRGYVMRVADETWLDAQAFGGDSGSGLTDARGRVRGVVTGVRVWRDRIGNTFTAVVVYPLAFTDEQWRAIR